MSSSSFSDLRSQLPALFDNETEKILKSFTRPRTVGMHNLNAPLVRPHGGSPPRRVDVPLFSAQKHAAALSEKLVARSASNTSNTSGGDKAKTADDESGEAAPYLPTPKVDVENPLDVILHRMREARNAEGRGSHDESASPSPPPSSSSHGPLQPVSHPSSIHDRAPSSAPAEAGTTSAAAFSTPQDAVVVVVRSRRPSLDPFTEELLRENERHHQQTHAFNNIVFGSPCEPDDAGNIPTPADVDPHFILPQFPALIGANIDRQARVLTKLLIRPIVAAHHQNAIPRDSSTLSPTPPSIGAPATLSEERGNSVFSKQQQQRYPSPPVSAGQMYFRSSSSGSAAISSSPPPPPAFLLHSNRSPSRGNAPRSPSVASNNSSSPPFLARHHHHHHPHSFPAPIITASLQEYEKQNRSFLMPHHERLDAAGNTTNNSNSGGVFLPPEIARPSMVHCMIEETMRVQLETERRERELVRWEKKKAAQQAALKELRKKQRSESPERLRRGSRGRGGGRGGGERYTDSASPSGNNFDTTEGAGFTEGSPEDLLRESGDQQNQLQQQQQQQQPFPNFPIPIADRRFVALSSLQK